MMLQLKIYKNKNLETVGNHKVLLLNPLYNIKFKNPFTITISRQTFGTTCLTNSATQLREAAAANGSMGNLFGPRRKCGHDSNG
jgi:hypothetical protein